jgi:hypothetical protein
MVQAVRVCCFLSTLMLAIAACASRPAKPQPQPSAAALAAHGIECHKERATGSLVEATVCTSAAQRARAADDVQKTKDWMNNVPAGPCLPTAPCN